MPKVVAIVQARMGSSRLPGKVARKLAGRPMLSHTIERLKKANKVDDIVIATSEKEEDKRVVEIAKEEKVHWFCGLEENVLARYIDAAQKFQAEIIIRITGDCPLIDPGTVDELVSDFYESKVDYMRLEVGEQGYPRGLDAEIFYLDTLLKADRLVQKEEKEDRRPFQEHVTLYIYRHPERFKIGIYYPPAELKRNYRLCVDELADFNLLQEIYQRLYQEDNIIAISDVIELLDNEPKLAGINKNIEQKRV